MHTRCTVAILTDLREVPMHNCCFSAGHVCVGQACRLCGAIVERMPIGVGRFALYIGLPLSIAVLILAFCSFFRRERRNGEGQKSHVVAKVTEELPIPKAYVGYVIGRGGAKIKKVQEENSVKVFFRDTSEEDKEEGEEEGSMQTAVIIGRPENVARAKDAIMAIVVEKQSQPKPQTMVFSVPTRMVGRIIGKQGSMIRQLQNESKARILVEHNNNPRIMQTQVSITGQEPDIDRACILLKELLEQIDRRPAPGAVPPSLQFSAPSFKPHLRPAVLPSAVEPVTVYASAVDEDCCIWVQVVGPELEELGRMVESMTRLYPQEGRLLRQPAAGDYCAACFEIDGCWYRARLQCPAKEDRWNVLFVDYGDVGTCPASELKEMRQEHTQMKCQAIKCQLAHIRPSKDSLSFLEALDELSLCAYWKPLQMSVVDATRNPPLVSLQRSTDTEENYDVATELVARGVAMWSSTEDGEGEDEEEGEAREEGEEEEEVREEEEEQREEGKEEEDEREEGEKEGEADEGDWEEKEKDKEPQEKSLQDSRLISDEGGVNVPGEAMNEAAASVPPRTENLVIIGAPVHDQDASSDEEAREGEESYQLCEEGGAASRYFVSGAADSCPVKIEWAGEDCKEVGLAGSFTGWRQQLLTQWSPGVFSDVFHLPVGEHQLRFLVDGHWQHSAALPIAKQADGGAVNCVTVERVASGDAVGRPILSTSTADTVGEGCRSPLAEETAAGSGNVSLVCSSSPENKAHFQQPEDDVDVTIGSNPSDLV